MLMRNVGGYPGTVNLPTISGLSLWLDAANAATLFQDAAGSTPATSDGHPVGRWEDLSGGARHLTQGTATARPTLKLAVAAGRNVVLFDGVDDCLASASLALSQFYAAGAVTMFLVVRRNSAGNGALVEQGTATTDAVRVWSPYSGDNKLYFDVGNFTGGVGRISGNAPTGYSDAWHVLECYRSGSAAEILVDGVTQVSGSMTDDIDSLAAAAAFNLGRHAVSGASAFAGHVAEVVVFAAAVDASSRAAVRAYLKTKWGTP